MKNLLIFSVLSAFLLTGCLWAFDHNKIKGSGTVTKEQRELTPFDKIDVTGVFTVYLSQGEEESVEVEIDDNLQQYVLVHNEGSKLVLGIKDKVNFGKTTQNNIFVTVKDIDLFRVTGVCTLKTLDPLNFGDFTLKVSGVANGDLEVHGNKLNVNLSGVTHVELSGSATEMSINQSGVGNFNARKLEAAKVTVTNSGVGSVSVFATQELSMNNSGVGSINYSGDAKIKSINSSGVGKIKKAN
jgi:hypothetical protein